MGMSGSICTGLRQTESGSPCGSVSVTCYRGGEKERVIEELVDRAFPVVAPSISTVKQMLLEIPGDPVPQLR
jgi:hypothetical protein